MAIVNKAAAVIPVFVLCTYVTCRKDTAKPDLWPRPVEPRLSRASQWHPYSKPPTIIDEPCPDPIDSAEVALNALVLQPKCTDAASTYLKRLAEDDAEAMADLSAAYYLRAKRQNVATDLLEAFEATDRAVTKNPASKTALFNRALMLEKIGLTAEAIEAWDAFLAADRSDWAKEARERRAQLQKEADTPAQWDRNRQQLRLALHRRARAVVARLIGPFPSAALRFFEEELLPEWAAKPSDERLAELEMYADVLSVRLKGDRYVPDIVRALKGSRDVTALREGIRVFQQARDNERWFGWEVAGPLYENASILLRRAGNPLALAAEIGGPLRRRFRCYAKATRRQTRPHTLTFWPAPISCVASSRGGKDDFWTRSRHMTPH